MRLILVHGWAFDAGFWNGMVPLLSDYDMTCVDAGYFGFPVVWPQPTEDDILVGHSLGFVRGMTEGSHWKAWIAINSFTRFIGSPDAGQAGCVAPAALRRLRRDVGVDATQALQGFYQNIGASCVPQHQPDTEYLCAGLDMLRDRNLDSNQNLLRPGLVIAARHDPLVPVEASLALATPARGIVWHEEGGHCLPQTHAAFCADAICAFVRGLS